MVAVGSCRAPNGGVASLLENYCHSGSDPIADEVRLLKLLGMDEMVERYERWVPIPGLPEAPLETFDCAFRDGWLSVTARYWSTGGHHKLHIDFDYVEAFKSYEEFSDPWMSNQLPLPQLTGEDHRWRFPLQEVIHSSWVARVMARNGGIDRAWRHLVISTTDHSLHIMTSGPPRKVDLI